MINFMYDKFNDFGAVIAAGDFPNAMNMGKASIERMTVDLKLPDGEIKGGPLTLTIKGSDEESGTYASIVTSGSVTVDMIKEGYGLPVPKTKYKYLKAAVSGDFEGEIQAIINTYLGK